MTIADVSAPAAAVTPSDALVAAAAAHGVGVRIASPAVAVGLGQPSGITLPSSLGAITSIAAATSTSAVSASASTAPGGASTAESLPSSTILNPSPPLDLAAASFAALAPLPSQPPAAPRRSHSLFKSIPSPASSSSSPSADAPNPTAPTHPHPAFIPAVLQVAKSFPFYIHRRIRELRLEGYGEDNAKIQQPTDESKKIEHPLPPSPLRRALSEKDLQSDDDADTPQIPPTSPPAVLQRGDPEPPLRKYGLLQVYTAPDPIPREPERIASPAPATADSAIGMVVSREHSLMVYTTPNPKIDSSNRQSIAGAETQSVERTEWAPSPGIMDEVRVGGPGNHSLLVYSATTPVPIQKDSTDSTSLNSFSDRTDPGQMQEQISRAQQEQTLTMSLLQARHGHDAATSPRSSSLNPIAVAPVVSSLQASKLQVASPSTPTDPPTAYWQPPQPPNQQAFFPIQPPHAVQPGMLIPHAYVEQPAAPPLPPNARPFHPFESQSQILEVSPNLSSHLVSPAAAAILVSQTSMPFRSSSAFSTESEGSFETRRQPTVGNSWLLEEQQRTSKKVGGGGFFKTLKKKEASNAQHRKNVDLVTFSMDSMMSGTSTLGRPQSESIFSSAQSSRTPSQVEATFSADSLLGTGGGGVDFLTPKKPQTQKVSPSGTDESFAANQVPQLVSSGSGGSSGSSGGSGFGIVRNVGSYVPTLTQEGFPGPDSSKSNAVTFNFQQHPQVVPKQPAPPQQLLQRPPLAQPPTAARNLALTGGVLRPYLHPLAESSGPVQERPSAVSPPSIKPSPLSKIGDNLLDPNRAASALSNPKRWSGDSFFSSDTNPLERRFSTMTASTVGIGMDKLWRDAPRGATISSRKEKDDDDEGGVEGLDGGAMEKMWGTPSPAPTPAVSSFEADDQSNRAATESVPSSTASLSADTLPKVSRISTSLMDEMMGAILQVAESVNEKSKTESAGRSGSTQSGSTQGGSTQIRDLVITAPERKSSADNGVRMTMPQPLPIAPDKVRSESPTAADLPANAKGSGGPSPPAQPNAAESDSSLREKQQRMEMFLSGRMPHVQQRGESLAMGKILEGLTGQPQRRATPIPGSAAQEGSKSADQYGTSPSQMEKNWNPIPQPFVDQPKQPQPSPPIASSFGPPSGPSTHFGQPQPVLPPGYPFPQQQPHQQHQQSYAIVNTSAHDADKDGNESDDLDESTVPPWLLPALRRDREEKYQQAARAAVERARAPPPIAPIFPIVGPGGMPPMPPPLFYQQQYPHSAPAASSAMEQPYHAQVGGAPMQQQQQQQPVQLQLNTRVVIENVLHPPLQTFLCSVRAGTAPAGAVAPVELDCCRTRCCVDCLRVWALEQVGPDGRFPCPQCRTGLVKNG